MAYQVQPAPEKVEQLGAYVEEQLRGVSEALEVVNTLTLVELNAEPIRPRTGMIVLADGTNWNPGSGAGFYGYRGAAWVLLG